MLGQHHTAYPNPDSVEPYQGGQQFLFAGPNQGQAGKQSKEVQPPYADAKDQARYNDTGLSRPR